LRAALFADAPGTRRGELGKYSFAAVPLGFRPLLGYLAVAMFAGVRPEEVRRADLERLDLRGRTFVIKGSGSKTRSRRVIELSRVAVIWLRLWQRLCPGAALVPANFRRKFSALRAAAGVETWPADVLRHTFASYHYAMHADRKGLQAAMGHSESEDTLDKHYRAVATIGGVTVSRKLAGAFWGLTPRAVRTAQNNLKIILALKTQSK
jgi:integrase